MARSNKPMLWLPFAAGGLVAALTIPVLILITGILMPLGILPTGTANDLARTLDLPLTVEAAADVIAQGHQRKIDLGQVNGHCFFNVASIGLSADLANGWSDVAPRSFDFDGKTFRKPGGIAPQMVWEKSTNQMTLELYIGARPAMLVPLRPVDDFHDNPFASG